MVEERLTSSQAETLRAELEELEGPRRTEVIAAIKKAREFGDLSENFEYHAAKNEQGLLEARIRNLRARLDHAEIVEEASGDEVGIGSVVEVEDESGEKIRVEVSAVGGSGTVSPTSPRAGSTSSASRTSSTSTRPRRPPRTPTASAAPAAPAAAAPGSRSSSRSSRPRSAASPGSRATPSSTRPPA